MYDLAMSTLIFVILCAAAWGGRSLFRRLPAAHRDRDTLDFARVVSGLLITFTALVLSLLLSSVNGSFRKTETDLQAYSAMITQLDNELRAFGAEADDVRAIMRRYTVAAIATTWPDEPRPAGTTGSAAPLDRDASRHGEEIDSLALGDLLQSAEAEIRRLAPSDRGGASTQTAALARIEALLDDRWTLISEAHTSIPPQFLAILLAWLAIVFTGFGMTAPPNAVSAAAIGMVGVSVAAAFFVTLELDGPLDGFIQVSSEPLRHALLHLELPRHESRP